MLRTATIITSLLLLGAGTAHAQQSLPGCDGHVATLRINAIKPGQQATFAAALRAQNAWYASRRIPTYTRMIRILERGGSGGGTARYSTTEAMTVTIHPDPAKSAGAKHDAAWDAFVAQYAASSTIKEDRRICLPDLSPP